MELKNVNIQLRLYDIGNKRIHFDVVQNDANTNVLNIQLYDRAIPFNLATSTDIFILFEKPDGNHVQARCTIVDSVTGKIKYTLGGTELQAYGSLLCSINVNYADGSKITFPSFSFNVKKDLANDGAVQSTSEFTQITSLINEVGDIIPVESARVIAENTRIAQENDRIANDIARENTESIRNTQETARNNAEGTRSNNEVTRNTAEGLRNSAETSRIAFYNGVVNVENTRVSNENSRVSAEINRATQEGVRQTQETARQTNTTAAINNANTATTNLNNAVTSLNTNTILIYKASVVNFSDIATTYTSPQNGWVVQVTSNMHRYRYNGASWIDLGVYADNTSIVISATQPSNPVVNPIFIKQI